MKRFERDSRFFETGRPRSRAIAEDPALPKKYRDPLFLSDIKGLKQAEVASQLNLLLPTTKSRIQRARKLIAQGYVKCCDFTINQKGHLVGEIKNKEDCKVCN